MGLDLYLVARKNVATFSEEHAKIVDACGVKSDGGSAYITIEINVIYWRKAEFIANWLREVASKHAGGLGPDVLQELAKFCIQVVETKKIVETPATDEEIRQAMYGVERTHALLQNRRLDKYDFDFVDSY